MLISINLYTYLRDLCLPAYGRGGYELIRLGNKSVRRFWTLDFASDL